MFVFYIEKGVKMPHIKSHERGIQKVIHEWLEEVFFKGHHHIICTLQTLLISKILHAVVHHEKARYKIKKQQAAVWKETRWKCYTTLLRCYHLDSQCILHKVIGPTYLKMRKDYLITWTIKALTQLFIYNICKHLSRVA